MARICKSDHRFFSYLEVPVNCGEELQANSIQTAYYSPDDNEGNSGTLYISFSISK